VIVVADAGPILHLLDRVSVVGLTADARSRG
jgi:hypothetical protein